MTKPTLHDRANLPFVNFDSIEHRDEFLREHFPKRTEVGPGHFKCDDRGDIFVCVTMVKFSPKAARIAAKALEMDR